MICLKSGLGGGGHIMLAFFFRISNFIRFYFSYIYLKLKIEFEFQIKLKIVL